MRKFLPIILLALFAVSCEKDDMDSDSTEELVVEGWIENGHAPVVLVSSTLPVSSTARPISDIADHILRYAEVYIEHNGEREYPTACLTDKYIIQNYFTSSTLRGKAGETYKLHVKWKDYEATAECTIPSPTQIDTIWYEKAVADTSFYVKTKFTNDPSQKKYYNSFMRCGNPESNIYKVVNFSAMNGANYPTEVTCSYSSLYTGGYKNGSDNLYFHPGDTVSVKLATVEKDMYDFWNRYADIASTTGSTMLSSHSNLIGNVNGGIGYWAGYGIDIKDIIIPEE